MEYFKVVAETGNCSTDYARWEERATCGHKHRTLDAAIKCRNKLTKIDKNGNCSQLWYNAKIHNQDNERVEW